MTSTTSAARTATLEDDQYNERRHRTIIFSSSWVPQGGMRDLAHLSQVDCQFGSRPKPFQDNNLQFDTLLVQAHLAHFAHAHRERELWKNERTGPVDPILRGVSDVRPPMFLILAIHWHCLPGGGTQRFLLSAPPLFVTSTCKL